ncbi:MAG: stage V sporulation protein G [Pirellulaceae bacterium]|nr:stage V sporulation protein G [Pirellulaceae bacterium]
MEITEIRIKLMESSEDRLRAFCSITIDECFVIRDLKIIDGTNGPFVAMPSRKLSGHCQRCNHKNHLRASYCNHCGAKLQFDGSGDYDSPQKLYADVAHPINSDCREMIQNAVIEEFEAELQRSNEPGYRSRYDDDFEYAPDASKSTSGKSPSGKSPSRRFSSGKSAGGQSAAAKSSAAKSPGGDGGSGSSQTSTGGKVPRPKFLDRDDRPRSPADSSEDDDDGFGAGVF